ncbi:MAG: nucleotide-binding protein [Candidatus Sulfotelmatobacter sp.]
MARINQTLLAKIKKKLGVTTSRVYAVINKAAREHSFPADVAALVVARDLGIAITRFATPEDWILIRGIPASAPVSLPPTLAPTSSTPRSSARTHRIKKVKKKRKAAAATAVTTGNKVWVVYGRDEKRRDAVFTFLRALNLNPIEWTSALAATKKGSPHVSEVLDVGFAEAVATVVLLTPDDEGRLKKAFVRPSDPATEKNLTGQPRQNVLFEAGMAFGRQPDKTILVEVGTLRPISDIVGRHTVRLSNAMTTRQQFVVKLKAVGCPVDDTGTDWHTKGDFS